MKSRTTLVALSLSVLASGVALAAEPVLPLDRAEAVAVRSVPVTLAKAVAIAERQGHGKVMNIVSRPDRPDDRYVVTLVDNGRISWGTVDAVSGIFAPSHESTIAIRQTSHAERADVTALENSALPLAKAVRTAESYTHGKAGDAGIETMRGGKLAYEVRVLKDGSFHDVWVDPASGKVLEAATA